MVAVAAAAGAASSESSEALSDTLADGGAAVAVDWVVVVLDEVVEPLDERVEGSTVYELVGPASSSSSSPPQAAPVRVKIATVKMIR